MAASRESIDRLYTELFGRPADDGGAAYWMKKQALREKNFGTT